jgi:hypothetical protein
VLAFDDGTFAELSAAAATGATSLTVNALAADIANAAEATFAGGTKQARVTAAAAVGATTVSVDELEFGIADNSEAKVEGSVGTGAKFIPAGTVMARLSSGKGVPRSIITGAEAACCILASNASDDDTNAGYTGYGELIGGVLYENLLPEADSGTGLISSTYKTELAVAGVGTGFAYRVYSDSRLPA